MIFSLSLKGEHIDYCGYSVLPMALDQDIVSVCAGNESGVVEICNSNPTFKYVLNTRKFIVERIL